MVPSQPRVVASVALAAKAGVGGKSPKDDEGEGNGGLMPPADLRAALKKADTRGKPSSCVVGLTRDKQAVILVDHLPKPRKLLAQVKAQGQAAGLDVPSLRFGRVSVSGKQVAITVNKAVAPAVELKLRPVMRAAGHPVFTINADPAIEDEPEDSAEGSEGKAGQEASGQALATDTTGAMPANAASGPAAPAVAAPAHGTGAAEGADASRAPLIGMVPPDLARGVQAAVAADPSRKPALARLLAGVRAGVEGGDPRAAEAGLAALRQAVGGQAPARDGQKQQEQEAVAGQDGTALNRIRGAADQAQPTVAPASPEPPPLAADSGLAALARSWREQQGSDPLLSGQGDRTAAPPSDDVLARPVLFQQPSEMPRNLPFAPPEPQPALAPGRPLGPPPGLRPPGGPTPQPGPALRGAARRAAPSVLRGAAPGVARGALRWVGRRALGIVGLFIPDEINQRVTTDEDVAGHPDLDGRLSVAPGSRSGMVEISGAGEDGAERTLGELSMDSGGKLYERDGSGPVLGQVDHETRTIVPTPEGEAWLQRRAGEAGITLAPPAPGEPPGAGAGAPQAAPGPGAGALPRPGTPGVPQEPAPGQAPQPPAWLKEVEGIETFDGDEREFIERQAQGGMKHDEIVRALDERRRGGAGATRGSGPPSGTTRAPVSASPNSPPGPPYPGPDVTPMDRQERKLVQELLDQGKGEEDVRRALAERRAKTKPERDERIMEESRNLGLPPDLFTDWQRYRDNAVDADPAVQTGELTRGGNPKLKVERGDFAVHHLWAMETVRNHPALFAAAARAGWSPDEGDNTFIAAKNKDAQQRMEEATGERRPIHDNGHNNGPGSWNATNDADAEGIEKQLESIPPGPEYDQQARRLIEEHQKVLRERARKLDRITMLPGAAITKAA